MTTTVYKQLATKQDLTEGSGKVIQQRNGQPLELDEINILVKTNTIAALRAITGTFQGQEASVLGYLTPGDGGGGPKRRWDTGKAIGFYTDNGGSIIVPGDGSAAWLWGFQEFIDIRWYGAVGDYDTGAETGTNNFTAMLNAYTESNNLIIPDGNYLNGGTGGAVVFYTGTGLVYTGTGATLNDKFQPQGNIGGNTGKNHFNIACIPRCDAAGVFSLLDDANHTPLNVVGISQPDLYQIKIDYKFTSSKINGFIVAPDDALAPYGVVCGGDVGNSFANIRTSAPFSCGLKKTAGIPELDLNPLWAGGIALGYITAVNTDASIIRVTHPNLSIENDPPLVSLNEPAEGFFPVISFYDEGTIDIMMQGDAAGFISYNGATWNQALSDNIDAPTLTWQGNAIRVDHGGVIPTNKVPIVSAHGSTIIPTYIAQVVNVSTTYFDVAFYNFSGTLIAVEDTTMQFWYRKDMKVPCTWKDHINVNIRRGLVQVPSALYKGVTGNNFWVTGIMEY